MKWYIWALIGLAVAIGIWLIVRANNKKKAEAAKSNGNGNTTTVKKTVVAVEERPDEGGESAMKIAS
jgi:hypothetical protein